MINDKTIEQKIGTQYNLILLEGSDLLVGIEEREDWKHLTDMVTVKIKSHEELNRPDEK